MIITTGPKLYRVTGDERAHTWMATGYDVTRCIPSGCSGYRVETGYCDGAEPFGVTRQHIEVLDGGEADGPFCPVVFA